MAVAARGVPHSPEDLARHEALVYSTVQGDARWLFTGTDGRLRERGVDRALAKEGGEGEGDVGG